jgi:hypothetical protein
LAKKKSGSYPGLKNKEANKSINLFEPKCGFVYEKDSDTNQQKKTSINFGFHRQPSVRTKRQIFFLKNTLIAGEFYFGYAERQNKTEETQETR